MKVGRREFGRALIGLSAVVPGLESMQAISIDTKKDILRIKTLYPLSENDMQQMHKGLDRWKEEYPQLKDLPVIIVDSTTDVEILGRVV